jgi:hypothetical protein
MNRDIEDWISDEPFTVLAGKVKVASQFEEMHLDRAGVLTGRYCVLLFVRERWGEGNPLPCSPIRTLP